MGVSGGEEGLARAQASMGFDGHSTHSRRASSSSLGVTPSLCTWRAPSLGALGDLYLAFQERSREDGGSAHRWESRLGQPQPQS